MKGIPRERALRPTKTCPRCGGSGRVGYDPKRAAANALRDTWSHQYHAQVVAVKDRLWAVDYFGVGIATKIQGGYWKVRVYTPEPITSRHRMGRMAEPFQVTRVHFHEPGPKFPYSEHRYGDEEFVSLTVVPVWDVPPEVAGALREMGRTVYVEASAT